MINFVIQTSDHVTISSGKNMSRNRRSNVFLYSSLLTSVAFF